MPHEHEVFEKIAGEIHGRWVNFIKTGEPALPGAALDWPRFEGDDSPVMIFDRIPYERGSKIEYAGIRWTVYSDREMLADESIGKCRLVERSSQIKKGRPLTVLEIKCLFFAEKWQINHARDPLFLLEGEDRIPIPMEYGYANGGI